jgi:hypothetical protein
VNRTLTTLALAAALTAPAVTDAQTESKSEPVAGFKADAKLPDGAAGFNGQIRGVVLANPLKIKKENGTLAVVENTAVMKVVRVTRVWERANKAKNPESIVGQTILVRPHVAKGDDGKERPAELHVKFLARLKPRAEVTLNVRQQDGLTFVVTELNREQRLFAVGKGELTPKPVGDPTKVPAELRGFSGRLIGKLVSKDTEKGELVLQIRKVDKVWRGNKAKDPRTAVGRTLLIDGVFGRFLDTLLTLKPGDGVRIETKHVKGDRLKFLGEGLDKVELPAQEPRTEKKPRVKEVGEGSAELKNPYDALRGLRGMLVGRVEKTDAEAGTLVFKLVKVKKVWRQNKAKQPERAVGRSIKMKGVFGKFLDVLLVLKPGDTIEVASNHIRGDQLQFAGEWLKKIETDEKKDEPE